MTHVKRAYKEEYKKAQVYSRDLDRDFAKEENDRDKSRKFLLINRHMCAPSDLNRPSGIDTLVLTYCSSVIGLEMFSHQRTIENIELILLKTLKRSYLLNIIQIIYLTTKLHQIRVPSGNMSVQCVHP